MSCPLKHPFIREISISQKIALFDKYGNKLPKDFLLELLSDLNQIKQHYSKKFDQSKQSPYIYILRQPYSIKELLNSNNFIFEYILNVRNFFLHSSISLDPTLISTPSKWLPYIKSTYKPIYSKFIFIEDFILPNFTLGDKKTSTNSPVGIIFITPDNLKSHNLTKSNFKSKFKSDLAKFFDILAGKIYKAVTPFSTSEILFSHSFDSDLTVFLNKQIEIIDSYISKIKNKG